MPPNLGPPVCLQEHIPLGPQTTLGVGGTARYFLEASSEDELVQGLGWASQQRLGVRILGGGSNVVVADAGFSGLVVGMRLRGVRTKASGEGVVVTAAAGEPWDDLVAHTVREGWAGLECLSGIPGLAGATPIQNVGAYGQEVSQSILSVRVLDLGTLQVTELPAGECRFGYRTSLFKVPGRRRYAVLSTSFHLVRSGPPALTYAELRSRLTGPGRGEPTLAEVREQVIELRRQKSLAAGQTDQNSRSCGSFFLNPAVTQADLKRIERSAGGEPPPTFPQGQGLLKVPAAWLIQRAGFAPGVRQGRVGLSTRHALALVAHEGAIAAEVIAFAHRIRSTVEARFGVRLVPEPDFWGFERFDDGLPSDDRRP